jgi:hypothetical protein
VSLRYARENAVEASVVLRGRIRHVRRIEWSGNEVSVYDQVEGKGRHRVESRVVWAPSAPDVELEVLGGAAVAAEEAFVSERFGERVPTSVACVAGVLELPVSIGFRLRLSE